MGARLLPTLLGVCLVYLLSAGEIDGLTNAEDGSLHPSSVWIAFFVGMITMVLQLRFLDFYT